MTTTTLAAFLDPFLSLLYPPRCLLCKTLGTTCLCDTCSDQIVPIPEPYCSHCGKSISSEETDCYDCHQRRPAFNAARAMGAYDGTLRAAIHQFKYRDRPQMAEPLGHLLAEYAQTQSSALNRLRFDAIIAMPMHPTRKRLRGYNQSERLARIVARELCLSMDTALLVRRRRTRPQVGLSAGARRKNLVGAFAVPHPSEVVGKTILLVDDVISTGSSLHESALTLSVAGDKAVYALTLAAG
jgi:competence protein ComFC